MCTYVTLGLSFVFWCSAGGIGSVLSGILWGARYVGRLGASTNWKDVLPCGSILGGGAGAASVVSYVVVSGLSTLRGGVGIFCCCGIAFLDGGIRGGAAMLKIS